MKNKVVRLFAAGAVTLALLPLAGCGSGGGSSPVSNVLPVSPPTPTPSPYASVLSSTIPSTSDTDVTTRANYDNPDRPSIVVTFPGLPAVGFGTSARYHVYRNDVIVSEVPLFGNDEALVTGDEPPKIYQVYIDQGFARPIDYLTISPSPAGLFPPQLVQKTSPGVPAFSADTPIVYRITVIRGTLDRLGQTTYTETEVGRSNPITPYR